MGHKVVQWGGGGGGGAGEGCAPYHMVCESDCCLSRSSCVQTQNNRLGERARTDLTQNQ